MKSKHINDFVTDTLDLKAALDENPVEFRKKKL